MKIALKKDQNIFFFSDPHYNHKNICRGVSEWDTSRRGVRDFDNLDQMNTMIVNNINNVVDPYDILICGGDWSFGGRDSIKEFRDKIICRTIHHILGNHDHHIKKNKNGEQDNFASVQTEMSLNVIEEDGTKYNFFIHHFPMASWLNMGDGHIHLHGHVHLPPERRIGPGRMLDIGLDGNGMNPYSLKEIVELVGSREIKGHIEGDHHVIK